MGSTIQQGLTRVTLSGQAIGRAVRSWRTLFKDAYHAEMEHFVNCIVQDKIPSVSGMDGLKAVEAVIAINRSIKTSLPVTFGAEVAL